jgi:hypothetical protein
MLATYPSIAREALQALIDDELASANQTWDDAQRQGHALRALEVALEDLNDGDLAAAAAALYLREHPDLAHGRAVITEIAQRGTVAETTREAVLRSPAMLRTAPADDAPAPETAMDFSDLLDDVETSLETPSAPPAPEGPVVPTPPPLPATPPPATPPPATPPPAAPATARNPAARCRGSARATCAPRPSIDDPELHLAEPPGPSLPPLASRDAGALSTPSEPVPARPSQLRHAPEPPPPAESAALPAPRAASGRPRPDSHRPPPTTPTPPAGAAPTPLPAAPSTPPPPDDAATARASLGIDALRAAMDEGDDAAAHALAQRLARDDETRAEALAIERRRFLHDPSCLGALDAMATLCVALRRSHEAEAVLQLRGVLRGESAPPAPRSLAEVPDPPDGIARVLFPPAWGPFPELGAVLWETLGPTWRRTLQRTTARESLSAGVFATSALGRTVTQGLRLLQLPRTTPVILGALIEGGAAVNAALPTPTLMLDTDYTQDTPRAAFVLGYGLEGTRTGHLPASALPQAELARSILALRAAYVRDERPTMDPETAQVAARLVDGVLPRVQRRLEDLVGELGDRLTAEAWRSAVSHAQHRAGLWVSGDFGAAAEALLAGAPREVPRDVGQALLEWEPLRDLARFAISEEYLLLRW